MPSTCGWNTRTLEYSRTLARAHTHPRSFSTFSFSTFVYHCLCAHDGTPRRSNGENFVVMDNHYHAGICKYVHRRRGSFEAYWCTYTYIKPRYAYTHIPVAVYVYRQLETLLVPPPPLYYLHPYYKSHFAGHSSLSIVPVHFNFRPRCKFHLCVVLGKLVPMLGRRFPYGWCVGAAVGWVCWRLVSFQFIRRTVKSSFPDCLVPG